MTGCWVCEGDPTACRCPNRARTEWVRVRAADLADHVGATVCLADPENNATCTLTGVTPGRTWVDITTDASDWHITLSDDYPVYIQSTAPMTVPTEVGDQFILPI